MNRFLSFIIVSFLLIIQAACSSSENKSSELTGIFNKEVLTPGASKKIFFSPVQNRTGNSVLSDELMVRLKKRIIFEGRLSIAENQEQSDMTVNLEILLFIIENLKFDTTGNAIQKRIRSLAGISIINSKNNNPYFKGKEVEAIVVFSEFNPPIVDEYSATCTAADILSERILSVIMTGWYKNGVIPSANN
jgi:hypothetical protein